MLGSVMRTQLGIVILVVVCVGMVVALMTEKKRADTQQKKDVNTILEFSNQLVTADLNLDDLHQVNLVLTNDLAATRQTLTLLSNQYVTTAASLSKTSAALKSAQDQIADLEAQNQALDQRVAEMTNTIDN